MLACRSALKVTLMTRSGTGFIVSTWSALCPATAVPPRPDAWLTEDSRFFLFEYCYHTWHFFPDLHKSLRSCQLPYSTRQHLGVKETWTGNLSLTRFFLPACMPTLNINELTACAVKMHGVAFVLNSNQISFHFHNIPGSRACRAAQQRTKGQSSPPPLRQCMSE